MTPGALARRLIHGELDEPARLLGAHRRRDGWLVRGWHPDAVACAVALPEGDDVPMRRWGGTGVFSAFVPGHAAAKPTYRLRFTLADGTSWAEEDPYRFASTIGEDDLYFFAEGTHRGLWHVLGAEPMHVEGVEGVRFGVWAPHARRVSVIGDFDHWDGRLRPMQRISPSGVFELFLPEARPGDHYKLEILTPSGELRVKTDPFASSMECPPGTASRVTQTTHEWKDAEWMERRARQDVHREPMAIYEVHLDSWRARCAEEGYRAIATELVQHAQRFGFTHVELLPITEYPFGGSWGYQVSGYFAPTARYGEPDDFRAFVDTCHQAGIGVILDWVPAHFPRDDFALRVFDGEPLYEYADPLIGEHPDWGTLVFDFGRNEVRNFLMASAVYWCKEFHVDGLRVDAVASMLYRDYGRQGSDWLPNVHGGRENLEAIHFLREMNDAVHAECPGAFTVAEESTAWPGVTRSTHDGGLGFDLKWNMGWMHDTLGYFAREPVHRQHHQNDLTFASIYEHTEQFLMPLSHDEVVHGKGSLLGRMSGDEWQRFANLRLLYGYQYTRPGKLLLFMGSELAPEREWAFQEELEWSLERDPTRAGLGRYLERLGELYRTRPALWQGDPDPESFAWVDCSDHAQSVVSYLRRSDEALALVVLNMTPMPRPGYRIGCPHRGAWRTLLSSDDTEFGGSGFTALARPESEPTPLHGWDDSIVLDLPPLGCLLLEPEAPR